MLNYVRRMYTNSMLKHKYMKKWLLLFCGAGIILGTVIVLLLWKNRLSPTTWTQHTITTSYGLTAIIPNGFRSYDFSTVDFLDDSGQTFARCSTPNTNTTDACSDELSITMGILDLTAVDENRVQAVTGVVVPDGTTTFDLLWLLDEAKNDGVNKEETTLTVAGLPTSGVLITNKSPDMVNYYIHIEHPTRPIGIVISGYGSEAQNVKSVSETLLKSIVISSP